MSFFSKIKSIATNQNTAGIVAAAGSLAMGVMCKDEDAPMLGLSMLGGGLGGIAAGVASNKYKKTHIEATNSFAVGMAAGGLSYYGAKHFGFVGVAAVAVAEEAIEVVSEEIVA